MVEYVSQPRIKYGSNNKYIIPDFYIPSKNIFIEIKSRTYHMLGTASEKLDHVPRKYSKLKLTKEYKNSTTLIVCSAGELLQDTTRDLLDINDNSSEYNKDFIKLCNNHNIIAFISVADLESYF